MKVQADRDLRIQAGNCVMSAPEVFDQDDEVREAVKICPSGALSLAQD